ncbi:MAG: hypothetical protein ACM3JG_14025 [Thiohalocapsa sp.]
MTSIVLKATAAPERTDRPPPRSAGPLFRGNGDIDYLCGSCGFVIAAAMGPRQHVPFDSTVCPACSATNEFPADLRV